MERREDNWVHTPVVRALGLAACMSVGALWGCGGGGQPAATTTTDTATGSTGGTQAAGGGTTSTGGSTTTGTGTGSTSGGNTGAGPTTGSTGTSPMLANCPMFPADAVFNTRIDSLPVHPSSAQWASSVGATVPFHADWGYLDSPYSTDYYGIPFNTVDGTSATTLWPLMSLDWSDESDCALMNNGSISVQQGCANVAGQTRFPVPKSDWRIEGGLIVGNNGDRHLLVLESGACRLWETAYAYPNGDGTWRSAGAAQWNLRSNAMRPDTWTSSDAAGLPVMPLLAKADEAASGEIKHALRVTFVNSKLQDRGFIWPATHAAGSDGSGAIPFGALLRLKSNVTIPANWGTQAKAIAVAMQRYGLYVADNGANLFVQGEPNAKWDNNVIDQLRGLKMSDFEFVDTTAISSRPGFDPHSFAVPPAP